MSAMYDRHEVSVKVALYSSDGKRVLLMYYPHDDGFGLPGGHIDAGETPDVALERELREELGIELMRHRLISICAIREVVPSKTIKLFLATWLWLTVTSKYRTERVMAARNV